MIWPIAQAGDGAHSGRRRPYMKAASLLLLCAAGFAASPCFAQRTALAPQAEQPSGAYATPQRVPAPQTSAAYAYGANLSFGIEPSNLHLGLEPSSLHIGIEPSFPSVSPMPPYVGLMPPLVATPVPPFAMTTPFLPARR